MCCFPLCWQPLFLYFALRDCRLKKSALVSLWMINVNAQSFIRIITCKSVSKKEFKHIYIYTYNMTQDDHWNLNLHGSNKCETWIKRIHWRKRRHWKNNTIKCKTFYPALLFSTVRQRKCFEAGRVSALPVSQNIVTNWTVPCCNLGNKRLH